MSHNYCFHRAGNVRKKVFIKIRNGVSLCVQKGHIFRPGDASSSRSGFTLVELLVVLTILSIMAIAVIPRISNALGGGKGGLIAFTSIIARTFDNSFLRGEECYLAIHCDTPSGKHEKNEVLSRENGVSVLVYSDDGTLIDTKSHMLKPISFPQSLKIEEVVLSTGEIIRSGTAIIPFHPEGYSDDAIIHILAGDDRYSIVLYKLRKEPRVVKEYVSFEDVRSGNVL
ncbi:MAG TPA: type II secretion system protein [Spirochaetota bacterium]